MAKTGAEERSTKLTEATAEEIRRVFGDYVSRAGYGQERFVIVRNGKRIAALVGIRDFERLEDVA